MADTAPTSVVAAPPLPRMRLVLWTLVAVLALAAAQRLIDGFASLVLSPTPPIDLSYRWTEVHRWFAGQPVYTPNFAVYPPASYPMLWPLLGWLDFGAARWLWGLTTAAGLAWLARTAARESGAPDRTAILAGLVPLAAYATRGVIVNGQITLHVLPLALAGLLLLDRRPPAWGRDLAGAALLLAALAKPTLTAPFIWIVMRAQRPLRPLALIGLGYVALTVFAATFQPAGVMEMIGQFAQGSVHDAMRAAPGAHGNVHSWLAALGLEWAFTAASLAVLAGFGGWVYLARRSDLWVRLGAAALVARIWAFHYRYDDVLVAVAVVPLARMVATSRESATLDRAALVVLALALASIVMPARLLFPPSPWQAVEGAQAAIWLIALGFLLHRGLRSHA